MGDREMEAEIERAESGKDQRRRRQGGGSYGRGQKDRWREKMGEEQDRASNESFWESYLMCV